MKTLALRLCRRDIRSIRGVRALMTLFLLLAASLPLSAAGDAARGREVLRDRGCVLCHSLEADKSGAAPNLHRLASRGLNPASFTALLWNHAPRMWDAMAARNIPVPQPSELEVADLFAYFYSLRYFDPPGDAGRGKRAFERKRCMDCHPLDASAGPVAGARPVSEWPSIADPIVRLKAMWNHATEMAQEMERRGIPWPRFEAQEMADLWVFLRSRPNQVAGTASGSFGDVDKGSDVFAEHACDQCHTLGESSPGKFDLKAVADTERNFAAFGASMWNHQPRLARRAAREGAAVSAFEASEMGHLVAYLQEQQLFWPAGDAGQGAKVFRYGRCVSCHEDSSSGAPRLRGSLTPYTPERIAAALWQHGPTMLQRMQQEGISWRELTGAQLADLIAYVNTL